MCVATVQISRTQQEVPSHLSADKTPFAGHSPTLAAHFVVWTPGAAADCCTPTAAGPGPGQCGHGLQVPAAAAHGANSRHLRQQQHGCSSSKPVLHTAAHCKAYTCTGRPGAGRLCWGCYFQHQHRYQQQQQQRPKKQGIQEEGGSSGDWGGLPDTPLQRERLSGLHEGAELRLSCDTMAAVRRGCIMLQACACQAAVRYVPV